jgi:alpha-methylacyl-CoA racemase
MAGLYLLLWLFARKLISLPQGHDINYLALSGVLSMMPGVEKPTFPLNLLSDFAGGGLICAMGILMALLARSSSGKGQIVDVDMVSGTRYLSTFPLLHYMNLGGLSFGRAEEDGGRGRSTGLLDGGAPFYNVYTCKDGKWISVGCLEPHFFKAFIERFIAALPINFLDKAGWTPDVSSHSKHEEWPKLRAFMDKGFMTKTRDEWSEVFARKFSLLLQVTLLTKIPDSDACVAPVLSPSEAGRVSVLPVPQPHPNLVGSKTVIGLATSLIPGQHTEEILRASAFSEKEIASLWKSGALGKVHKARL